MEMGATLKGLRPMSGNRGNPVGVFGTDNLGAARAAQPGLKDLNPVGIIKAVRRLLFVTNWIFA